MPRLNFIDTVNEVHDDLQARVTTIRENLRLRGWEDDATRQILWKAVIGLIEA